MLRKKEVWDLDHYMTYLRLFLPNRYRILEPTLPSHGSFMFKKYCKKIHPIVSQGFGVSHIWRTMTSIREEVEHNFEQVTAGNSDFYFDNWTKQRDLYYVEGLITRKE